MPLLVVVAALSFGVRFGEFVTGVSEQPGRALAQVSDMDQDIDAPEQPSNNIIDTATNPDNAPMTIQPDINQSQGTVEPQENIEPVYNWRDAGDSDFESSSVQMELFEELKSRRKILDDKARELSVREALLKAAEQEIDQKYDEMLSLRKEIQDLLIEQDEEEKARVASLVKIYEGMKPKDAARIFNTLDLDVLLNVMARMSERKSAPIIASMDPERARTLTIMLLEQKSLPTMQDSLGLSTGNGFNS
jgi:flagellar motility protein MotE (MotC chaperone)